MSLPFFFLFLVSFSAGNGWILLQDDDSCGDGGDGVEYTSVACVFVCRYHLYILKAS